MGAESYGGVRVGPDIVLFDKYGLAETCDPVEVPVIRFPCKSLRFWFYEMEVSVQKLALPCPIALSNIVPTKGSSALITVRTNELIFDDDLTLCTETINCKRHYITRF
jgi:hypothetical protein